MAGRDSEDTVYVEAAARLHFGVLDLRGEGRRWFGGVGAGAPGPTVLVSASPAERLSIDGQDTERAEVFARRFFEQKGLPLSGRLAVHRALPRHAGLGSGTQLALAIARALAELHGRHLSTDQLAVAVGRGARSAVGTWTFADGGLVVEGGRPLQGEGIGPLIARLPFPNTWRVVVAVPQAGSGVTGARESAAIASVPAPPAEEVHEAAYLVLMHMLPAVQEDDLPSFGRALTALQELTGGWFAAAQGGTFANGVTTAVIDRLRGAGALGVGQSSWGPTAYGVAVGDAMAERLAQAAREVLGDEGSVYVGPFRPHGARVWRSSSMTSETGAPP